MIDDFDPVLPEGFELSPDGTTTCLGARVLDVWLYWDPRDGALVWDDPEAGDVRRFDIRDDVPDQVTRLDSDKNKRFVGSPVADELRFRIDPDGQVIGLHDVLAKYLADRPDLDPPIQDFSEAYRAWLKEMAVRPARRGRVTGGSFVFDVPADPVALWGSGSRVLHAAEEGTLLVGPPGVGKTTVAQQYVIKRLGIGEPELLGLPVRVTDLPIVYLAMDRPAQIARSFARMVDRGDADVRRTMDERLLVWQGAIPVSLRKGDSLVEWLRKEFGQVAEVVVDSYKDLGLSLVSDEDAVALNNALQDCVSAGIDWLGLHHGRKANGENKAPNKLDDVYGSRWLTAGTGSVVSLWGESGAPTSELAHLKQPAEVVGPLTVMHDRPAGEVEAITIEGEAGSGSLRTKSRRAAILARFHGSESLSLGDFEAVWSEHGVDRKTVQRDLALLVETGNLAAEGDKATRTYSRRYL